MIDQYKHRMLTCYALGLFCVFSVYGAQVGSAEPIKVSICAQTNERLKLVIVLVGTHQHLDEVAATIGKDIAFSGQFAPDVRSSDKVYTKKEIIALGNEGYPLALFLTMRDHGAIIEWRLYDTALHTMIKGKSYHKRGDVVRGWGHAIADAVWPELTGHTSSFSAKIAYCKQVIIPGKKRRTSVVIADYDGSNAQVLVATPTLHVAPRWNGDPAHPLLFYSEGTNVNIRLMCVTMQGVHKTTSNFDGINMLPTFSGDGKKVVYCASRGHGNCQLYLFEKGIFKRITHNDGNNVSPSLAHDGSILFYCSDFLTGTPQIYCYDLKTNVIKQITKGGLNFCPHYHQATGKLVYTCIVAGLAQVFVYDQATGIHTQITNNEGNKDECCWSPCGSYLLFSVEHGRSSRLALFNMRTREQRFITDADQCCSYPTMSPLYHEFPVSVKRSVL